MATQANLIAAYQSNPTLQNRYTQQEYLDMFGFDAQTPTLPVMPTNPNDPVKPEGVQNIIGQNLNQGGGYNPYDANANINTTYRPNYDFRKARDYNPELSDLQNQKIMQNMQNFKGYDYYNAPDPTGLAKFANQAINYVPYIGPIKRGIEFVTGAIGDKMPINKRAILENELRGSGVYTDDIGRIAIGPDGKYNTPEGIMAGYNANMMTDKTFDKRTGNISKSLQNKTSLTEQQINDIVNEIATTGKYSGTLTDEDLGVNNLFSNLLNVNFAKYNFKNQKKKTQEIIDFQKSERDRKKREKAAATLEKARQEALNNPTSLYSSGSNYRSIDSSGNPVTAQSAPGTTQFDSKTGKGRRDFNDGGRVYLYNRLK